MRSIFLSYKLCKNFIISILSLTYAATHRLPGIRFDLYGRFLAVKGFFKFLPIRKITTLLLNPVSGIRYFELDFAGSILKKINNGILLDVSSPRLLPLWAVDNCKFNITMVNPDCTDLLETEQISILSRRRAKLKFDSGIYAAQLPYPDNSFDVLTSISAIEHINGNGDIIAMDEFTRVVRPGGKIILTFPVLGNYFEEYRSFDPYGTQKINKENDLYFFQRFYDVESINSRIIGNRKVEIIRKEYFVENFPGCFEKYIQRWMRDGLSYTVKDPLLMSELFKGPTTEHPQDRMGNCHLMLRVIK